MAGCQFSIDREYVTRERLDLATSPAQSAIIDACACSTLKLMLVYMNTASFAAQTMKIFTGDLEDGSDMTEVTFTTKTWEQEAGATNTVVNLEVLEFCPCKRYTRIQIENGLGLVEIIATRHHCRTTPQQEPTPDGFLLNKVECACEKP